MSALAGESADFISARELQRTAPSDCLVDGYIELPNRTAKLPLSLRRGWIQPREDI